MKKKKSSMTCKHCGSDTMNVLWVDGVKCGDEVFVIDGLVNYYQSIGQYDLSPLYKEAARLFNVDQSSVYLFTQETYAFEPDDIGNFILPHDSVTLINEFGPVCNWCGSPLSRKQ